MTDYEVYRVMNSIRRNRDPYRWHFALAKFAIIVAGVVILGRAMLPGVNTENFPKFDSFVIENLKDEVEFRQEQASSVQSEGTVTYIYNK